MAFSLDSERNAKIIMASAMALFGTIGVITYHIDLPSSVIVMGRGLVSVPFLLLIIWITKNKISREDIRSNATILVASGLCLGLNWLCLFEAYKTIEISTATLCNYLTPAFVILVSPILLKEKLTWPKLICVLVAILGLAMISGIFESGLSGINTYGITCGIMAAVFYTGMIILNKKLKVIGPFDRTLIQLATAAVLVTVYSLITVNFSEVNFTTKSVLLVVLLGVVQTAICFTMYFGSMKSLKTETVAIYGYLEPIVSITLSVLILGEDLGVMGWTGAALLLGSTLVCELMDHENKATDPN